MEEFTRDQMLSHPLRDVLRDKLPTLEDDRFCENFWQYQRAYGYLIKTYNPNKKVSEDTIQIKCYKEWKLRYPRLWRCFYMIKNDGNKKKITTKTGKEISISAMRDKSKGLLSGVSDCFLTIPNSRYHGMYIEFKTEKGTQSDSQKEFQQLCRIINYQYCLVRSYNDFLIVIEEYMKTVDAGMITLIEQYHESIDKNISTDNLF